MRRVVLGGLVSVLVMVGAVSAEDGKKSEPTFYLTGGYFQIVSYDDDDNSPSLHEPVSLLTAVDRAYPVSATRGSSWHYWVSVRLSPGMHSPCSEGAKDPCRFDADLVKRQSDYSNVKFSGIRNRFDDNPEATFSISYGQKISREEEAGEYAFVVRVKHGDNTLFFYELPVDVR